MTEYPTRALFIIFTIIAVLDGLVIRSGVLFSRGTRGIVFTLSLLLALAFASLTTISVVRAPTYLIDGTAKAGLALSALLMPLALALYIAVPSDRETSRRAVNLVFVSVPLNLVINVILYLLMGSKGSYFSAFNTNVSGTLGMFGIRAVRLSELPGLSGSNTIASLCALGIIISAYNVRSRNGKISLTWLTGFLLISGILLWTDGRSFIAWSIIGAIIFKFPRKLVRTLTILASIGAVFSAWILSSFFSAAEGSALGSFLVRDNANAANLGVGTGRNDLWNAAFKVIHWGDFSSIFGYGLLGQFEAGISLDSVRSVFPEVNTFPHLHNTFLQTTFDTGMIGAVILAVLLITSAWHVNSKETIGFRVPAVSLLVLILAGYSEPMLTLFNLPIYGIFFTIVFYGIWCSGERFRSAAKNDK